MNNQTGFEVKAEQRQSWVSIAMVWAGGMICVPCLMIGGVLSGGGLSIPQIVASILIGYGLICAYMILIGMAAASAQRWTDLSPTLLLFWRVGICGGFTTFSTFSLESLTLLENGRTGLFALYALLSVALCLVGVWLGKTMIAG